MGGAQGSLKITFPKSPELKKVVSIYHLTPVQVEQMYQIFTVMYKKLNHGRAPSTSNKKIGGYVAYVGEEHIQICSL